MFNVIRLFHVEDASIKYRLSFNVLGLDKIEFLQSHQNMDIYQKAFDIIERFFGSEEEDARLVPSIDSQGQEYQFTAPDSSQLPVQGFEF